MKNQTSSGFISNSTNEGGILSFDRSSDGKLLFLDNFFNLPSNHSLLTNLVKGDSIYESINLSKEPRLLKLDNSFILVWLERFVVYNQLTNIINIQL